MSVHTPSMGISAGVPSIHPDIGYVEFILNGIKDGVRVGYNHSSDSECALSSSRKK